MDHKVSKDMISSGMIPSGEKTQADLGRTQYGSAPSPSKLMDAYKSMYEHHKKDADGNTIPHEGEELNEGKIPAGLQAYLDKKKGKKEDKKEMKEGMGLYANIHAKRKRGGKMRKKGDKGAPSSQDFANAAKTAKEEVDKFDIVFNHFISEGYSEKEAYAEMVNLTEEELDEMLGAITRATKSLATRAAEYGANIGKKGSATGFLNPNKNKMAITPKTQGPVRPTGQKGVADPKPGDTGFKPSPSQVLQDIKDRRKKQSTTDPKTRIDVNKGQVMQDEYQHQIDEIAFLAPALGKVAAIASKGAAMAGKVGKVATKAVTAGAKKVNNSNLASDMARGAATQLGANMASGGSGGQQKQRVDKVSAGSYQAASADLFDIVKGQLLDEGLSEEEIKDIMLTLTPDEIMEELSDVVKRNDALNRERAIKAAQERKVPDKVREASKRQMKAGTPREDKNNPYTTQDKKTIINYNKDKGSM